jgi:hypothetical protein
MIAMRLRKLSKEGRGNKGIKMKLCSTSKYSLQKID